MNLDNSNSFWRNLKRLREEMDGLFDDFMGGKWSESKDFRSPFTSIKETEDEFIVRIELPGVKKEEIIVSSYDSGIEVKVDKNGKIEKKDEKKGIYESERSYSGFYRRIPLPAEADSEGVEASYDNGILELKTPKRKKIIAKRQVKLK